MKSDIWQGCYDGGWQGNIVPEAFSHPAKFSRGLIHRIYKHAYDMGWIEQRSWVLDPFAGVGLGALDAITRNLNWIGIELEEKFVKLGEQNIELWQRQFAGWPNLGTANIIQGDSRELIEVLKTTIYRDIKNEKSFINKNLTGGSSLDLIVSSPPYSEGLGHGGIKTTEIDKKKRLEGFIHLYGHTPGNLANMKEGDIDLVVSLPPYAEISQSGGREGPKKYGTGLTQGERCFDEYGETPGQLGSMKEGSFDLCVSSPPYEGSNAENVGGRQKRALKGIPDKVMKLSGAYGLGKDNLGNTSGDTFWSASREIVQQCYELVRDGGKPVSDGKGINFCEGHK